MFDIGVSGNKWNIHVNHVPQAEGEVTITYPNKLRYCYKVGSGSAEQFISDLQEIERNEKAGQRDRYLGELANEIKRVAFSYRKCYKSYRELKSMEMNNEEL